MKISFAPKTVLGKWSVRLILFAVLFFAVFQFVVAIGYEGGTGFFDNPMLAIPILLVAIFGTASFFVGAFSIMKNKERSILVFLSAAAGFAIFLFLLGEITNPH